jgi:hypothetical protein
MLASVDELGAKGAGLRVLNLDGDGETTSSPMGSTLFTIMAVLAQMELENKRERDRVTDSLLSRSLGTSAFPELIFTAELTFCSREDTSPL